jgi:hypothetical protein
MRKYLQPWFVCCAAVLVLANSGAAFAAGPTGMLNDTGITRCWIEDSSGGPGPEADNGSHPRQDCRYGRDRAVFAGMPKLGGGGNGFDLTKISNDGTVIPETAALGTGAKDWACTLDNVTGLIWEVKTSSGLRSQGHSYTWFNSNGATNGGAAGTSSGGICFSTGRCDTENFVADVNVVGLCGATDWRMPSKKELISILDLGRTNPPIDPSYFHNTPATAFWTASPFASDLRSAWIVFFNIGEAFNVSKGVAYQVRLVRAGK